MKKIPLIFCTGILLSISLFSQPASPENISRIPLGFAEESGIDGLKSYASVSGNCRILVHSGDIQLHLFTPPKHGQRTRRLPSNSPSAMKSGHMSLSLKMKNANPAVQIQAEERLPWESHYFIGSDPAGWRTHVPNYSKVRLTDIYQGIDLVYSGTQQRLKYDFFIKPGTDPGKIRFSYEGARSLDISAKGDLKVGTVVGTFTEKKPVAYQDMGGERHNVEIRFRTENGLISFDVGDYSPDHVLVIDPEIVFSAVIGGNSEDVLKGACLDEEGNIYITGNTQSSNLPVSTGAMDASYDAYPDAFLLSLDPSGSRIRFLTYIGGPGPYADEVTRPVIDHDHDVFLAMSHASPGLPRTGDLSPGISEEDLALSGGVSVLKISSMGDQLLSSVFLGIGSIASLSLDPDEAICFTGQASAFSFTLTQPASRWDTGILAGRLSKNGESLSESVLLGPGTGMLVHISSSGEMLIAGVHDSPDFPVSLDAYQLYQGGQDIFWIKKGEGGQILYASSLGGSGDDFVYGMVVWQNHVYLCGSSDSPDFPVSANAFDPEFNGRESDGFFLFVDTVSTAPEYVSWAGEPFSNTVNGIAADENGIFLAGTCDASDGGESLYPLNNAFLKVFDPGGQILHASWNFGGAYSDDGKTVLLDSWGNATLIGSTDSDNFPTSTLDSGNYYDIFITRVGGFITQIPALITVTDPSGPGTRWIQGETVSLQWISSGPVGSTVRLEIFHGDTLKQILSPGTENDGYKTWEVSVRLPAGDSYRIRITSLLNPSVWQMSVPFSIEEGNSASFRQVTIPCITSKVTPVMDGILDDALWHFLDKDTLAFGGEPGEYGIPWKDWNNSLVTWQAAWCRETNKVYVAVTVRDDVAGRPDNSPYDAPDQEDCIEFYTDGSFDGGDYWERYDTAQRWFVRKDVMHYLYNYPDMNSYPEPFPVSDPAFRPVVKDMGDGSWTCEAEFIVYNLYPGAMKNLSEGQRIGWDIWYNDSDNQTLSSGKYIIDWQTGWNYAGKAWRNADYFGAMILGSLIEIPYFEWISPDSLTGRIYRNQIAEISWESSPASGSEVGLVLMQSEDVIQTIAGSIPNDGSYLWMVQDSVPEGEAYHIEVASKLFDFVRKTSASFDIRTLQGFLITQPAGDSVVLETGTETEIRWESFGDAVEFVNIHLLQDSGAVVIHAGIPNDGSYLWHIPPWLDSGSRYRLSIEASDDSLVKTVSPYPFIINQTASVMVRTPVWRNYYSGDTLRITWQTFGPVGPLARIDLYSGSWYVMTLTDSMDMTGSFLWRIPESLTFRDDYRIKVGDQDDGSISDYSEEFSIHETSPVLDSEQPVTFRLLPCQPNPFNPETWIRYETAAVSDVSLGIYNMLGEKVVHFEDSAVPPGRYQFIWNGCDDRGIALSSGVYVVSLRAGDCCFRQKVILTR
jgi:hypothetical protein